jgi:hypothetical protein
MPTRIGREYLLTRTMSHRYSITSNDSNMSEYGRRSENVGPRTVLVVFAVGKTQYTKLLLEEIYDMDKQILQYDAYDSIVSPMALLVKKMTNALEEAIKRHDTDIYLHGSDSIDLVVGHT